MGNLAYKLEKENLTEKLEIYKKMSQEYKSNFEKLKGIKEKLEHDNKNYLKELDK